MIGNKKMKNVLIVMSTNVFSGAEKVLYDYLKNNYIHNFVLYTSTEKNVQDNLRNLPNVTLIADDKMKVISIRRHTIGAIGSILHNLIHIRHIVKEFNIDVIYGNNTIDMLYVMLYKKFVHHDIGAICHVHDIVQRNMYHQLISKFSNVIDVFFVPSKAGKASFIADVDDTDKIKVVHNGCPDTLNYTNYRKNNLGIEYNLLFVGQICERKRVDSFINIIHYLNQLGTRKYHGIIVGGIGEDNSLYTRKFYQLIADDQSIEYRGLVDYNTLYTEIYPNVDGLVLTSDRDPLPTVILEAMCIGIPVFSRRVDGASEMIEDGIDGVTWPYDESIDAIAYQINNAYDDINRLSEMTAHARKKVVKEFSLKKKNDFINKIIEDVQ